jgi:predicted site-specific integrase-resolvase
MRLSVWAELQGISYKTAWRMLKAKTVPVHAYQLPTGTVVVDAKPNSGGVALYARVSSSDQKEDLDRQLSRLTEYAVANKMVIVDAVKEIGSGLNGHRRSMVKLLSN